MPEFHHSSDAKQLQVLAPRSDLYQGPFGRICGQLPPWEPPGVTPAQIDQFLLDFANANMVEDPGAGGNIPTPSSINEAAKLQQLDDEFDSRIPAGYTYFGQFVDHDITFDPASSLVRRNDPNALLNFRTPRLDLDNLYGRGPDDQPYLFDDSPKSEARFLIGNVPGTPFLDLPRNELGRALIGDMRNDENSIVSQLQLAFLLAHNKLVDRAVDAAVEHPFAEAQRTLRWLYQWIVLYDFLPRIAIDAVVDDALNLIDLGGGRKGFERGLADLYSWKHQPFMPVEFSVAAYRFGHSMVRNSYRTNINRGASLGDAVPIFDNIGSVDPDDLRGFRAVPELNVIEWDWFLEMTTSRGPFPQKAHKIDTKLANALTFLHEGPAGDPLNVLAYRNLKRGWTFGLPSGTAVANKFCIDPINLTADEPDALWYYILKESESLPGNNAGEALGRVGSNIVCAVFAGLLAGDPQSWINQAPCWTPGDDPLLREDEDNVDPGDWTLASIIRLSGLPIEADDFS